MRKIELLSIGDADRDVIEHWNARYPPRVARKRKLTSKGARALGERERGLGLDPDDDAAQWLEEHDPPPKPEPPKSAAKSKVLHQWRQRQQRGLDKR